MDNIPQHHKMLDTFLSSTSTTKYTFQHLASARMRMETHSQDLNMDEHVGIN